MTLRRLITVREIVHRDLICYKEHSYSEALARGRWPWVSRMGPSGESSRLWVDIDHFRAWLRETGRFVQHDWPGLESRAVLVGEAAEG